MRTLLQSPDLIPLAYFITFTCYGTHLPGSEAGWVDRRRNEFGSPRPPTNIHLEVAARRLMKYPAYYLKAEARKAVHEAILETCRIKGWEMLALHVRETHVHNVVRADIRPDLVRNRFKADASRSLNERKIDVRVKRWTERGSCQYLWTEDQVRAAIQYVLLEQGEPMERYSPFLDELLAIER